MSNLPGKTEVATLGGGCFWCLDAVFSQLEGVQSVVSGYAGGRNPNPTYDEVCQGTTGHAEVVQITFDPLVISFADLLRVFFATHDPTTLNRQGNDMGTQYRSVIFTHSAAQEAAAREVMAELTAEKVFDQPIVTELAEAPTFYAGEGYHQDYFRQNPYQPYCQVVISPKLAKFRKQFATRMKR